MRPPGPGSDPCPLGNGQRTRRPGPGCARTRGSGARGGSLRGRCFPSERASAFSRNGGRAHGGDPGRRAARRQRGAVLDSQWPCRRRAAGRSPGLARLALVSTHLVRQLERSLSQRGHPLFSHYPIAYALSVGRVRAGSLSSTVPDELECEGRVGVPVGMASSEVRRMFAAAVADAAQRDAWLAEHAPQIEWYGGQFDAVEVDPELPAFQVLRAAHTDEFGIAPELEGAPYGSDMRLLVHEAETPAILYGPGDIRQAHATDEWIAVDEIVQAARVEIGRAHV